MQPQPLQLLPRRRGDEVPSAAACCVVAVRWRSLSDGAGGRRAVAGAVALPGELDGDGGPRLPARGVESHRAAQLLSGEFVAEVLGDVFQVLRFQSEGFGYFERGERRGGEGEIFAQGLAEAPRDELLAAEVARPE